MKRVPVNQSLVWIRNALVFLRQHGFTVLRAAIFVVLMLYFALQIMMMITGGGAQPDPQSATQFDFNAVLRRAVPSMVVLSILTPFLLGGLLLIIRRLNAGEQPKTIETLHVLRHAKRVDVIAIGILQIVLTLVGILLVVILAGENYWPEYFAALSQMMQGKQAAMPEPSHPFLMTLSQFILNYFNFCLIMLPLPLILLQHKGIGQALSQSLQAALFNWAPLLFAGMLLIAGAIALTFVLGMVVALATALMSAIHPIVGGLVAFIGVVFYAATLCSVLMTLVYFAWTDLFADQIIDKHTNQKVTETKKGEFAA